MTTKADDEKKFNETLKRMLKTPPKPNTKTDISVRKAKSKKTGVAKQK